VFPSSNDFVYFHGFIKHHTFLFYYFHTDDAPMFQKTFVVNLTPSAAVYEIFVL